MTLISNSVLLLGSLSNEFTAKFIQYILKNNATSVYALYDVQAGEVICSDLVQPNLHIFYGSSANSGLVQKIINDYKISVIFSINYPLRVELVDKQKHAQNSSKIARKILWKLTIFLEAVRKTNSPPKLIEVFFAGKNVDILPEGRISGTFKPKTLEEANFASVVAFLHSYVISYGLNVQVANFKYANNIVNDNSKLSTQNAFQCLVEIANIDSKIAAKISNFEASAICINKKINAEKLEKIAARYLVYSAETDLSAKFVALLLKNKIEVKQSCLRPEIDTEADILSEIISVAPSHIVYLPASPSTGDNVLVYNEAGPQNLLINSRDNLFKPLSIAIICSRIGGVHFTYMGAKSLRTLSALLSTSLTYINSNNGKELADRYFVINQFTNASLKLFETSTLNVCIELESQKAEQEVIKYAHNLLDLTLRQKLGEESISI